MPVVSHEYVQTSKKEEEEEGGGGIYDLVDIIQNHAKFKLNRIRITNFHLKLFDTAETLKYSQGY